MTTNENTAALAGAERGQVNIPTARLNRNTKLASVLRTLLERGDRGLNCFEAVDVCRDFFLRSTISELQVAHGLLIERRPEIVPNRFRSTTRGVRYWPSDDQRPLANALLGSGQHPGPIETRAGVRGDLFGSRAC